MEIGWGWTARGGSERGGRARNRRTGSGLRGRDECSTSHPTGVGKNADPSIGQHPLSARDPPSDPDPLPPTDRIVPIEDDEEDETEGDEDAPVTPPARRPVPSLH